MKNGILIPQAGMKFSRWLVLPKKATRHLHATCLCDCGTVREVANSALRDNLSKSCGCLKTEVTSARAKQRNTKHSKYHHPVYHVWDSMIARCTNPNNRGFKSYGARGITVCPRWLKFENFYSDMGDPNGMTLERVNNNKGYCKSNCKWATYTEQARNKRNSIRLKYNGQIKPLVTWAEELGLSKTMLYQRVARGWTPERILQP